MTNVGRARELIRLAGGAGAEEFCVCSGSRNSPLLAVLGASDHRLFSFVDERAAAFFALGRIKQHGKPVAVVTTSGTAVAELLPATVEAYYSSLPLMLITADRPARFRGTGAPQAIEQEAIFGPYAVSSVETWDGVSPIHLNIEFDEPLIDAPVIASVSEGPGGRVGAPSAPRVPRHARDDVAARRPLIILGALAPRYRDRVRAFALKANVPVYAESLSGLREDPALAHLLIASGERMIGCGDFDGVIRVGSVPTLRFWRDLEHSQLQVIHCSASRFRGLSRGTIQAIDDLPDIEGRRDDEFFERDRQQAKAFEALLDAEPQSELAMIRKLSRELPKGARIYLGNSLPIREWDLAATREPRGYVFEANRGANGIDGQLSTFFGWCAPGEENVAVIGDLTALYDLNAPWIAPQLDARFRVVIVNNRGGRIFSRVPSLKNIDRTIIENAHDLTFEHWAKMWKIEESVTELCPDAEASRRAWQRYDELWS
jgi:2-succinyl-5-enolpyruvyl-6-hydroxy-3-cyclohexene-1-carboxylate synthase